ncbi:hypothetical protein P9D57_01320 [Bacillus sonorensis]|uniref:hypothetical protein n=1 Tax=Bacillus sonorensis TaxID=119858 RepID=UPI002DB91708|nr:hypothetical protein [Bacillus sonorensis]MEC1437410.1 hypothetical protein [Bacillus sonorensis]
MKEWMVLLLPIILTGILGLFFNTKLEKQKHILQKKIQDFSLYNERKHSSYTELYKLIKEAEGQIFGLRGLKTVPSFTDCNTQDIDNYLKEFNTPQKAITEITHLWEKEKYDEAIQKIREYEKMRDINKAESAFFSAKNYWLLNELYFKEELNTKLHEYFKDLYSLYVNYEMPEGVSRKENRELKSKINDKFDELKSIMKKELSMFTE